MKSLAPWVLALLLSLPLAAPPPACAAPVAAVAAASVLDLGDAGLSMRIPDNWSTQRDGVKYFVFPNDQSMAMVVAVVDDGTVEGFVNDLKRNQQAAMANVKSGGRTEVEVNGLRVSRESGTGDSTDGAALWTLAVVHARRPVIFYTLTSKASLKKHEAEYDAMLGSLQKVGEGH